MIRVDEKKGIFGLYTKHTAMILQTKDDFVGMAYYGTKISIAEAEYLCRTDVRPYTPSELSGEALSFHSSYPHVYPFYGCGNYRETAFRAEQKNGADTCCLKYIGCTRTKNKPDLAGLPHSFSRNNDTETLILYLHDEQAGVLAEVIYTIFADSDIIAQSVRIQNQGKQSVMLRRVLSACMYLEGDLELLTLNGTWARERIPQRIPIGYGKQSIDSINGASSHTHNPFLAALRPETTETQGEVWGMAFVYSGNFLAVAEKDFQDKTQLLMGIHPETFCWELESGKTFSAPEVLLNYSSRGLGTFSRNYHDFIRKHIIRSRWQYQERPVLVNNWEATYFDFDSEKLLSLADTALQCGLDMLVLDDGWFGHRDSDNSSLGDWFVNEKKLPEGLKWLGEQMKERTLQFGLWFEPEMISPDSELFQKHPDWTVSIPDRSLTLSRNQCVLDMTRPEVRDYLFECMEKIIREAGISYIKWDMNRQITEAYSLTLPAHRQREFFHRYLLGVYALQERLLKAFPDLLLENCAGGGGRFDCGMLYYSPQIWCSDNTDACDRAEIQLGTSIVYPPSCMGAHVSVCPNHIVGRNTDFMTRAHVALAGTFGYELDLTKLSATKLCQVKEQIKLYHQYSHLTREGNFYRLYHDNFLIAWQFVSPDQSETLVTVLQIRNRANQVRIHLPLQGIAPDKIYLLDNRMYTGSQLIKIGLPLEPLWGDGVSDLLHLTEKK